MYFQNTYQNSFFAEVQESDKEFSKGRDYNYHAAYSLFLVKVSAKKVSALHKGFHLGQTLDSLVLHSFSVLGLLPMVLAQLTCCLWMGECTALAHDSWLASS